MIEQLFLESSLWVIYFATVFYFLFLYFTFGLLGEYLSQHVLPKYQIGKSLSVEKIPFLQKQREIKYSLISIFVFGLFGVLPRIFYELHLVNIQWDIQWKYFPFELLFIFFWNEFHFYWCHRLLHRKWFFKRVHIFHHHSHIPTSFSTYSFHWFEAFLLSTVMIIPMFFYSFTFLTLLLLPFISIFMNTLGHWNYELFPNSKNEILKFSMTHSKHHHKTKGNFGFFLTVFDRIFKTDIKSNQ